MVLAHWPGRASPWYDDLRRIAAYGSVLGTFSTITAYFEQTGMAGQHAHYQPDEYRSPYLRQDVAAGRRDPISRWVRYFRRRAAVRTPGSARCAWRRCAVRRCRREKGDGRRERMRNVRQRAMNSPLPSKTPSTPTRIRVRHWMQQLAAMLNEPLAGFARSLAGATASAKRGCLIVNPWSFSATSHAFILHPSSLIPHPIIDVPAMGFAWIDPERRRAASAG